MSWLVSASCLFASISNTAAQQCTVAPLLPAYSHNDYYNARPLLDALEQGYQGVEVDYVQVGGELRVGHGRGETMPGRTVERLYLAPLRDRVRRCGWVQSAHQPFLLTIDYKDRGPRGYQALLKVLRNYADVVGTRGKPGAVRVVLVGWHPPLRDLARDSLQLVTVQAGISQSGLRIPEGDPALVGLVSLDYGKTMRWKGRGASGSADRTILQHIAAARESLP
ncbi:MAG TPA: hypothetical protein VFZ87_13605, partial [Gemmatimonadales bacterium]